VAGQLQTQCGQHQSGIKDVLVWSSSEFEEKVRKQAPELVERFFNGNPFPKVGSLDVADAAGQGEPVPALALALSPNLQFAASDDELG
jgi:hypothetical protein